ncbi:hypothetical protein NC653_005756 [Populus alba x Populus x berolinensis]|uniref:Uncharacterized protein n=1 Tax=Populus alba x Populus x berolinensis TaxID=444605 RepID=A0AAD6RCR1_9ROSI|nr:hypothetical protein NC653_005756 [Populus alba x Populus x berolinensis]
MESQTPSGYICERKPDHHSRESDLAAANPSSASNVYSSVKLRSPLYLLETGWYKPFVLEITNEVLPSRKRAIRHFGFTNSLSHRVASAPKRSAADEERGRTPDLVSDESAPNHSARTPWVLYLIVDCTTSRSIWLTLENALASPSTRIMTIHIALQELRQHDESVTAYLQRAKHYHDELTAAGRPLSTALLLLYQPGQNLFLPLGQPGIPTIRALIISGPLMVRTREASDVICAIDSITQLNFSLNASINLNTRLPIYIWSLMFPLQPLCSGFLGSSS